MLWTVSPSPLVRPRGSSSDSRSSIGVKARLDVFSGATHALALPRPSHPLEVGVRIQQGPMPHLRCRRKCNARCTRASVSELFSSCHAHVVKGCQCIYMRNAGRPSFPSLARIGCGMGTSGALSPRPAPKARHTTYYRSKCSMPRWPWPYRPGHGGLGVP